MCYRKFGLALLVLLLLVLSACNLSREDEKKTDEETIGFTPSPAPSPIGKPTVSIISPQTGAEVVVNEPILMSVNALDNIGITRVQLVVDGQIMRTFSSESPAGDMNKNMVIDYTPRTQGTITLQVIAFRGTVPSDPAEIIVVVRASQTQIVATTAPSYNTIPTIDPYDKTCRALINAGLNFRTGPSTSDSIITVLSFGEVIPIIGRLADNSWLKLRRNFTTEGWVNANYVTPYGDCASVAVIGAAAPTPTSTSTLTPPPGVTTAPTHTPTATTPPKPNLIVTNIAGPNNITIPAGSSSVAATYSVNITNQGGALNTQFSTIAILLPGGQQYDAGVVANLGAGQSISLSVNITFDTPGTFILQFVADSNDQIDESNEVDNAGTYNITVIQD